MSRDLGNRQAPSDDRIIFIHQGKAAYPELAAYKDYFLSRFSVDEKNPEQVRREPRLERTIYWHMMGFYPKRLPGRFVIHDYRSLSVGFGRRLKDQIKAFANHRPNLRIYQNDSIRCALGLRDGVPEILLPMGVPDDILAYRSHPLDAPIGDFCYIGSMLPERQIETMIGSFLKRYGGTKTLWLYGDADDALKRAFQQHRNVIFAGRMPQSELFGKLRGFGACVCYFPNHYPHVLQTPTKLLEYAALGLRIIANEQPQSRIAERQYGIACLWGSAEDMFAGAPDRLDWSDNTSFDPGPLLWRGVIAQSGIDAVLGRLT